MKHSERTQQAGFSQIEVLITVAIIGISAAVALPKFQSLNTTSQKISLDSSLATLNSAVNLYLASGGNIPGDADVNAVIAKLKTVRKKVEGDTSVIAFEGSFIDPRVILTQDSKQKAGINWNQAEGKFVRDESDNRFHLIRAKEASEVVEEERFGSSLAWGEDWIWGYTETEDNVIVEPTLVSLTPNAKIKQAELYGPTIKISSANYIPPPPLSVEFNLAVNSGFELNNGINDRDQTWSHHGLMAWTTHQENVEGWNTSAWDKMIEIWQSGFNGMNSYGGNYHVEFNANEVSTLWQEVDVTGMDAVNISFAHGQRVQNTEQLRLMVGTTPPATKEHKNHGEGPAGQDTQGEDLEAQGMSEILRTDTNAVGGWEVYTDVYAVPEGATTLYFAFQSVGEFAGNSYGNFLDDVKFEPVSSATMGGLEAQIVAGNSISNVILSGKIRLEDAEFEDDISLTIDRPGFNVEKEYGDGYIELTITGKAFRWDYAELLETVSFTTTSLETHPRTLVFTLNDGFAVSDPVEYVIEFE